MQFQAEFSKTNLSEASIHHIKCSNFFRDKKDLTSLCKIMRDHIRNSLRLACPWRTKKDEILSLCASKHR